MDKVCLELLEDHLLDIQRSSKDGVMPASFYDCLADVKMILSCMPKEELK